MLQTGRFLWTPQKDCSCTRIILDIFKKHSCFSTSESSCSSWKLEQKKKKKKQDHVIHSCQPLLGVNLSPAFVNPYAGWGLLFFLILNFSRHVWRWKEEAMLCEIHTRDFKSHFRWDFLAYCTRPVSVHLAMACVGCSFDSFSVFLLSLKPQQNLMKIMFSCIHFPLGPYPPKIIFWIF